MTNSTMLKELVERSGLKKTFIAKKLELSYNGYLKKENGTNDFTAREITVMKDLLNLSNKQVSEIFLS
jgi:DNA-binding XRE family transcriptional regulator